MLETLDYTIRIDSTLTFLYFDLYLYSAYAAHYIYFIIVSTTAVSNLMFTLPNLAHVLISWYFFPSFSNCITKHTTVVSLTKLFG